LKAAVEGQLTEAWRDANPPTEPAPALLARILAERRARWEADLRSKGKGTAKARYQEPAAPNVASPSELPEGWARATVGDCTEWSLYGPRFSSDAYAADGTPVIRTTDINGR